MALAKDYFSKGAATVGRAWVARAERLLESDQDSLEHAYLLRLQAVLSYEGRHDYETALDYASQALDAATRYRDQDLMAMSLLDKGRALVSLGRVDEGMEHLEEAAVGALGGDLQPYATSVVFCNTISVCRHIADYGRAGDWSEAAKRWCQRQEIAGFPGMCRVYRAEIMRLRGDWTEAEVEARKACEELRDFSVEYAAAAFYEVGEVRLRVGDLEAADEAFSAAHELGLDPQPGLSRLWLQRGETSAAFASIARALAEDPPELDRARLLPAQVEIAIAAGDLDSARSAAEELRSIAVKFSTPALEARAVDAEGRVALEAGDGAAAVTLLRKARSLWQQLDAPYEVASTRMVLADAYRTLADEEQALLELKAACTVFEKLGALPDQQRATALMGERAPRRGADQEHVVKTFMFTDIVDSTPLVDAIGDEAWTDLVRWHDQVLRSSFAENRGQEVDNAGDGFFVAFESGQEAINCAVEIQRALKNHRRDHGFAPRVRIGIHRADASESGASYRGKGVHAAARIAAAATGGQIICSVESVPQDLRVPLTGPRDLSLKGLESPVQVVEIDWD
jgi:class 3 adenylate cyclase